MDFKSKKGFITVYVMLAMMFFIVFVVTATVTASRKIKLQEEANKALYDIYNKDVDSVLQDVKNIPIYTKAQFLEIADWMKNKPYDKYIYINDVLYHLNPGRYTDDTNGTDTNGNNYIFELRTDLYFDGELNTNSTEISYFKYIMKNPCNWVHGVLKKNYANTNGTGLPENPIMDIGLYNQGNDEYNVYLYVNGQKQNYGEEKINITTAKEFLNIGNGTVTIDDAERNFPPNATYTLQNNIVITQDDLNGIDFGNRVNFTGTLLGNNKVVEWQGKMTVKNSPTGNAGFFSTNSGIINDLTFAFYSADNDSVVDLQCNVTNFGILAGINNAIPSGASEELRNS